MEIQEFDWNSQLNPECHPPLGNWICKVRLQLQYLHLHLSDAFIQSDYQVIHFFVSTCVPWESNPQLLRC